MSAIQAVFAATGSVAAVAIGLVVAGVAVLAGVGWALITAGAMLGFSVVAGVVLVMREVDGGQAAFRSGT